MPIPPSLAEQLIALYGGLGGWAGMAYATYLQRVRDPDEFSFVTTFGVFSMGFALLATSGMLVANPPPWASLFILVLVYTLLIVSQTLLFGIHATPEMVDNVSEWLSKPYFVHPSQVDDAVYEEAEPDDRDDHSH